MLSQRHRAKTWRVGEIRNISVLVAVGVDEEGYRRIFGLPEGHEEDKGRLERFPVSSQATGFERRKAGHLWCLPEVSAIGGRLLP